MIFQGRKNYLQTKIFNRRNAQSFHHHEAPTEELSSSYRGALKLLQRSQAPTEELSEDVFFGAGNFGESLRG